MSNTHPPMTYAQALTDARSLIVQQSSRIRSDAQKIRAQAEEIERLRATADEMSAELERLRLLGPRLAEERAAREHAEAAVGRQQMEIEALVEVLMEKHMTSIGEFRRHMMRVGQKDARGMRLHDQLMAPAAAHAPAPAKPLAH